MSLVCWMIAMAIVSGQGPPPGASPGWTSQSDIRDQQSVGTSLADRPEIDAALRAHDWDSAERLLAAEIDRNASTSPARRALLVLIARVFFLDGKPLNAAVALKKAEAIAPLDAELRFTLVLAYIRLGQGEWARPELERLVQSDPGKAEYRYWLGRIEYDAAMYMDAITRFQEALERDPRFMRAHDNLGLCYEELGDDDKAKAHYREAIRLNREMPTKSPWPSTNLGILLRERGEFAEAASLFREALQYDPNFAHAHYELGRLLEQEEHLGDAIRAFERAAAIDVAYAEPHYALARVYRRLGQIQRANEALATFLRLRAAREQKQQ